MHPQALFRDISQFSASLAAAVGMVQEAATAEARARELAAKVTELVEEAARQEARAAGAVTVATRTAAEITATARQNADNYYNSRRDAADEYNRTIRDNCAERLCLLEEAERNYKLRLVDQDRREATIKSAEQQFIRREAAIRQAAELVPIESNS